MKAPAAPPAPAIVERIMLPGGDCDRLRDDPGDATNGGRVCVARGIADDGTYLDCWLRAEHDEDDTDRARHVDALERLEWRFDR